jgi:hypothetical protein
MRSLRWALSQNDWCPYKKKRLGHKHTLKTLWNPWNKMATYKTNRKASQETDPADTLIQNYEKINLSHPVCGNTAI